MTEECPTCAGRPDEGGHATDCPVDAAYRRGWNEGIAASGGSTLVQIIEPPPAEPQAPSALPQEGEETADNTCSRCGAALIGRPRMCAIHGETGVRPAAPRPEAGETALLWVECNVCHTGAPVSSDRLARRWESRHQVTRLHSSFSVGPYKAVPEPEGEGTVGYVQVEWADTSPPSVTVSSHPRDPEGGEEPLCETCSGSGWRRFSQYSDELGPTHHKEPCSCDAGAPFRPRPSEEATCETCGCPSGEHVEDLDGVGPACCACTDKAMTFHPFRARPSEAAEGEWRREETAETARAVLRAIREGSGSAILDALADHEQAIARRASAEAEARVWVTANENARTALNWKARAERAEEEVATLRAALERFVARYKSRELVFMLAREVEDLERALRPSSESQEVK